MDRFYHNGKRFVPSGTTVIGLLDKPGLVKWASNCAVGYLKTNNMQAGEPNCLVTTTYGDLLLASSAHEQESMEAADYGTYIHTVCQYSLENNIKLESPHEMTNDFMAGLWKWKEKHNVKVIAMEHEVLSEWYGGRLDLVCELDDVVTLVDFKTGKGSYYDTWKYQLAGYRNAWKWGTQESPYPPIKAHGILKFNKVKTKTKGYSTNYKDFTEYQATRKCPDKPRKEDGTLQTEKYTRNYEMDLVVFMGCVRLYWSKNLGIKI